MSRYAENTSVSAEASRGEIERTLRRYGASAFTYGWDQDRAVVQFKANDRMVRFLLPLPNRDSDEFRRTPSRGTARTAVAAEKAWEQACRQRWRALSLAIKAKLEAVEAEISEFEDEFLAHIVLPDGSTAGDWLKPQIKVAYDTNRMPDMLPALGSGEAVMDGLDEIKLRREGAISRGYYKPSPVTNDLDWLIEEVDRLHRDIRDVVEAHVKIVAAYKVGGRTPARALDTMQRIRRQVGT